MAKVTRRICRPSGPAQMLERVLGTLVVKLEIGM